VRFSAGLGQNYLQLTALLCLSCFLHWQCKSGRWNYED